MVELQSRWHFEVDRGPDWLFIRVHPTADLNGSAGLLAEDIWEQIERHFTYRVVLELEHLELRSVIVGQLLLLQKRVHQNGGLLRLCGLSPTNQMVLKVSRLGEQLPNYESRRDAVLGYRPHKPR